MLKARAVVAALFAKVPKGFGNFYPGEGGEAGSTVSGEKKSETPAKEGEEGEKKESSKSKMGGFGGEGKDGEKRQKKKKKGEDEGNSVIITLITTLFDSITAPLTCPTLSLELQRYNPTNAQT
jgi:hypothetical protein